MKKVQVFYDELSEVNLDVLQKAIERHPALKGIQTEPHSLSLYNEFLANKPDVKPALTRFFKG